MAEQTFRSPGFSEREIDLTARSVEPVGTPAGVIGTAEKGPAFVPITVGSPSDFKTKFGRMDPKKFGPYAVNEFLKNRQAVTYLRILGSGTGVITEDGTVPGAGFVPDNTIVVSVAHAIHSANEAGIAGPTANFIRAIVFVDGAATVVSAGADSITIGSKTFEISFNPESPSYISKVLNTDPDKYKTVGHLLYSDFAIDPVIASVAAGAVPVVTKAGSTHKTFDTRYTTPKTTSVISQPFGTKEYELFSFESLDDGAYANTKYKVSITNVMMSTDSSSEYGTFTVQVREFDDTDSDTRVLEQFNNCSLNPQSDNYIAKVIGDKKVFFNFDADVDEEKRLVVNGKYGNRSKYIRVIMNDAVERRLVPAKAVPFGFKGMKAYVEGSDSAPAAPLRHKVTRGTGPREAVDSRLYWGLKFERTVDLANPNLSSAKNACINAYTSFKGASSGVLSTQSVADTLNKFTLANIWVATGGSDINTLSVSDAMKLASYVRPTLGTAPVGGVNFGDLSHNDAVAFNRFTSFNKFTMILAGGFDGLNILDKDMSKMNDKSASLANSDINADENNTIASFLAAGRIMTDPMAVTLNIVSTPGIREPYITDRIATMVREYGKAVYIMDVEEYDDLSNRLYDDTKVKPDVRKTAEMFNARAIDNNYVSTYFPNVFIEDLDNNRIVEVPSSVAALSALGFNDKVAYPWFAPAGFNRAALDFVKNVDVRLNSEDRNILQDARINPIATFPGLGYVIFAQKTLQQGKSSLDRVNVRRLMLEIKRLTGDAALRFVFENNTKAARSEFVSKIVPVLSIIQSQAGIEKFKVIIDESNNTQADVEAKRMNGRIVVIPTRSIENIAIDFVITHAGIQFV